MTGRELKPHDRTVDVTIRRIRKHFESTGHPKLSPPSMARIASSTAPIETSARRRSSRAAEEPYTRRVDIMITRL